MEKALDHSGQKGALQLKGEFMRAERTLLAWIRTSLQLIGFGFTLAKVFQRLSEKNVLVRGPAGNVWTAEGVGMALLAVGIFALVAAMVNHHQAVHQLRVSGLKMHFSLAKAMASALVMLGLTALLWITLEF